MATISNKIAQTPNSRSQNTIQNAENVGRTLQNIYIYVWYTWKTERPRFANRRSEATDQPRIGVQSTSIIDGTVLKTYKHPNYFSAIKQFDKKRLKKNSKRREIKLKASHQPNEQQQQQQRDEDSEWQQQKRN